MSTDFMQAMTKAATDRTKFPVMVVCHREVRGFAGFCMAHADCRSEHWRQQDAEEARLDARTHATRPKKRA